MSIDKIYREILAEYGISLFKHPELPVDVIHMVSIMNEESGEAIKTALQYVYEGKSLDDVKKELIQTATMCFRVLNTIEQLNLPERRK